MELAQDLLNHLINSLATWHQTYFSSVSSQQAQGGGAGGGIGGAGSPPPAPKITLNSAVVNRIHSLPFVSDVIPNFRASVTVQSQSESKTDAILSMDPEKLQIIAPTLEYTDGSTIQSNNPSTMIVSSGCD